jgi:hypothetical protein
MAAPVTTYVMEYTGANSVTSWWTCPANFLTAAEKHAWCVWNDAVYQAPQTPEEQLRVNVAARNVLAMVRAKFVSWADQRMAMLNVSPNSSHTQMTCEIEEDCLYRA